MAVVKIPAFPKGIARGVWANDLAQSAVYAQESEAINFDTGAAVNIFSIPEGTVIMGIGLEVVTVWSGGGATMDGGQSLDVNDSDAQIAHFGPRQLLATGFYEYPVLNRTARTAGAGVRNNLINVDVNAPEEVAIAGVARVWLKFKPGTDRLYVDNA